jgi:2-polyprenyl-3-methyl-5-hydroxy-6-metoxy-1,4-benzoquinol methylase
MSERLTAIEANRLLYRELAGDYDRTEACLVDARQHERLRAALLEALAIVSSPPGVLDACGGSGNAAELLVREGVVPIVVDVSAEMLAHWQRKARGLGVEAEVHATPIEDFLTADTRTWDLIVFSSALHHLEDPAAVLRTAASRLTIGGAIVTIYDPTLADRTLRALRLVDWMGHLLLHRPAEFVRVIRRRLARHRRGVAGAVEPHIGRTAERHALAGIDDLALRDGLERVGLEVIVHDRLCDARLAAVRLLLRLLRRPSAFRLLVVRRG